MCQDSKNHLHKVVPLLIVYEQVRKVKRVRNSGQAQEKCRRQEKLRGLDCTSPHLYLSIQNYPQQAAINPPQPPIAWSFISELSESIVCWEDLTFKCPLLNSHGTIWKLPWIVCFNRQPLTAVVASLPNSLIPGWRIHSNSHKSDLAIFVWL